MIKGTRGHAVETGRFYLTPNFWLPIKETIDYAKNLVFFIGLQAIGMAMLAPHGSGGDHWWWRAIGIIVCGTSGLLNAAAAMLYRESWPEPERPRPILFTTLSIVIVAAAGLATKLRIAEGW